MDEVFVPGAFDDLPPTLPLRINFKGEPIGTAHAVLDDYGLRFTLTITDEGLRELFMRGM